MVKMLCKYEKERNDFHCDKSPVNWKSPAKSFELDSLLKHILAHDCAKVLENRVIFY